MKGRIPKSPSVGLPGKEGQKVRKNNNTTVQRRDFRTRRGPTGPERGSGLIQKERKKRDDDGGVNIQIQKMEEQMKTVAS